MLEKLKTNVNLIKRKNKESNQEPKKEFLNENDIYIDKEDDLTVLTNEIEETKEKPKQKVNLNMDIKDVLKSLTARKKKTVTKVVKKNRVSIDIGSSSIKIVEGMYDGKFVNIKNIVIIPTPDNSYQDGNFTDFASLNNAINNALVDNNIDTKDIIYTIESQSIITREVKLPSVTEKDIKQMMQFQVEEYFPVNLEEYIMQSKIVDETNTNEKKESTLSVSIVPKIMCEEYLKLTRSLMLKPIALDMNDNSIYKLLSESMKLGEEIEDLYNKTIAILDIGYDHKNIVIMEKGIFKLRRLVEGGGGVIDQRIADALDITEAEAEKMKLEMWSVLSENDTEPEFEEMKQIIQTSLSELSGEIERIFRYNTGRTAGHQIQQIYIYGGTSNMIDIDKYIETTFNIPTLKLNQLNNIKLNTKLEDANIMECANAIGAIIRM